MKKNPFMSMWLSSANAVAGSARSRINVAAKRQASAVLTEGSRQMVKLLDWRIGGYRASKMTKRR